MIRGKKPQEEMEKERRQMSGRERKLAAVTAASIPFTSRTVCVCLIYRLEHLSPPEMQPEHTLVARLLAPVNS